MAGNKGNNQEKEVSDFSKDKLELDIIEIKKDYNTTEQKSKEHKQNNEKKEITVIPYVFVSFDVTNSTKLKHDTKSWDKVIAELFKSMNLVRSYLNFWKFNGDELLFYKEIRSLYQLVSIIDTVYRSIGYISNKLSVCKTPDDSGKNWYKIDVKATIWMAGIDFENNFRINPPYGYDFIGSEIDEGFRLTKLATAGKCVIDPKIALLLAGFNAAQNESANIAELQNYINIFSNKTHSASSIQRNNYSDSSVSKTKESEEETDVQFKYNSPHALFARNYIVFRDRMFKEPIDDFGAELSEPDIGFESSIEQCVNKMRLVGYSVCKGIWDEKEYPIIWYSKNWSKLDKEVAYNEKIGNDEINIERINRYYKNIDNDSYGISTYKLLENIYRNIPAFSTALNKILQSSYIKPKSEPTMYKNTFQYINVYYILVCYLEETDSVLMVLRSEDRGHLANTWDFCCHRHVSAMNQDYDHTVFKSYIKIRYGIDVNFEVKHSNSIIQPFLLKPVYRYGRFHQGIVSFAKIDTSHYPETANIENDVICNVRNAIKNNITVDGYPYYCDAMFVRRNNIKTTGKDIEFSINGKNIVQLNYSDELEDSKSKLYRASKTDNNTMFFCSDTKEILLDVFNHFSGTSGER